MNQHAPSNRFSCERRIFLAALIVFVTNIAFGAEKKSPIEPEKKEVVPARQLQICPSGRELVITDPAQMPAMLEKLEKMIPETPDEAEELRGNKVFLLFNIAIGEARKSQYENAVAHLRAAHDLCGKDWNPEIRMNMNYTLATVHMQYGHYEDALPLAKTVLAYRERTVGPEHPNTLRIAYTVAVLQSKTGERAAAETLCRRVLKVREQSLGSEHEETLLPITLLAALCVEKGDTAAAETLYLRALKIQERLYGPDQPPTLSTLDFLANIYADNGNSTAAEPLLLRALDARGRMLGNNHPDTCRTALILAVLYDKQKKISKALPLAAKALKGYTKTLGLGHQETIRAKKLIESLKNK